MLKCHGGIEMCGAYTRVLPGPDIVCSNHICLFLCCAVLCAQKHKDELFFIVSPSILIH